MNAVDSALDPLVFDYISCGISDIVNNLWTWVAVLTAALSFWTIRTTAGELPPNSSRSSILRLTLQVPAPGFALHRKIRKNDVDFNIISESASDEVAATVSTPRTPASSPIVCDDDDVVTKGKFVAYYWEEEVVEEEEGGVEGGDGDNGVGKGWWETEELRVRTGGEIGWYKYQDLTAINGNVVRLWDDVSSGDGESYYDGSNKCNPRCCLVW